MKKFRPIVSAAILLSVILACGGGTPATPPPTEVPATELPATEAPAATESPIVEPSPTLVPIDLAGPPMEVGSTFLYVDGTLLVAVPGGEFIMGRPNGTDNPDHTVNLGDFWIYRTEVTNQQYARCVELGQCSQPDLKDNQGYNDYFRANEPVTGVMWEQAEDYCTFVHGRLPTEAEWEKAARGPEGNIYPWGSGAPSCSLLNFNDCVGKTTRVTDYPQGKSYYDLLDTAGNVYEWVADWYDPLYYRTSPVENPTGPLTSNRRSIRSTAYNSNTDQVPLFVRFFANPKNHRRDLGFRCVVDDPTYFAPLCQQYAFYGTGPGGGPSGGSSIKSDCPTLDINVQPQKCDSDSTYVTFNSDDPGAAVGIPGPPDCELISGSPGSFPQVYNCHVPTTATIGSVCGFSGLPAAGCPEHYVPSGDMCNWDGSGTIGNQCLQGMTYDAVNQCCTFTPGSGMDFPLCGPGSLPVEIKADVIGCLSDQDAPEPPFIGKSVTMPPACSGGNQPTCDPNVDPNCQPDDGCPEGQSLYCYPANNYCECR